MTGLRDLGIQARAFAPLHRNDYLDQLSSDFGGKWKIPASWPKTVRPLRWFNQAMAQCSQLSWRPDLIHETYFTAKPELSAKIPSVVTVYDMIHEIMPPGEGMDPAMSRRKRAAVDRAHHVICISESTRRDLIAEFNIGEEKISVVHLAAGPVAGNAANSDRYTARPFFLYVGQRGGYKNFDQFLEAYASSCRLRHHFDLIAFGGGAFSADEARRLTALGLESGRVRQVGGNDQLLDQLYRECHAFVYPSLYEGFGLPPLEAMQRGTPVVCLNTSSLPEVVGDAARLVDPASGADGLAHALEEVAFNDELRQALSLASRARAAQFSWSRCAAETLQVYQKVLGKDA